jgi:hypothetical protein
MCARQRSGQPPLEAHDDVFGRAGSRQLIIEVDPNALATTFAHHKPWDTIVHARASEAEVLARSVVRELVTADPVSFLAIEGLTLDLLACVWRLQDGVRSAARRSGCCARASC